MAVESPQERFDQACVAFLSGDEDRVQCKILPVGFWGEAVAFIHQRQEVPHGEEKRRIPLYWAQQMSRLNIQRRASDSVRGRKESRFEELGHERLSEVEGEAYHIVPYLVEVLRVQLRDEAGLQELFLVQLQLQLIDSVGHHLALLLDVLGALDLVTGFFGVSDRLCCQD